MPYDTKERKKKEHKDQTKDILSLEFDNKSEVAVGSKNNVYSEVSSMPKKSVPPSRDTHPNISKINIVDKDISGSQPPSKSTNDIKKFRLEESLRIASAKSENNLHDTSEKRSENLSIGNYSEIHLIKDTYQISKNILIPYGNNQIYDLLREINNDFKKNQIKTATLNQNGTISFNICSSGKYNIKHYFGKIDEFGIYCSKNKTSYLIPIEYIQEKDYKYRFVLDKREQEIFKIETDLTQISVDREKIIPLKQNKIQKLIESGKIVLKRLGFEPNDYFAFDDAIDRNGTIEHNFHEYKIVKKGDNKHYTPLFLSETDISMITISAELMKNGHIISFPQEAKLDYDFIFVDYINKDIHKVKLILENKVNLNSSEPFPNFFGYYNRGTEKAYLIPASDMKNGLINIETHEIRVNFELLKTMKGKEIGDVSEVQIASEFMKKGYEVFTPIFDTERYDFIVRKNRRFYTVQVRTGADFFWKKSHYIRFRTSSRTTKGDRRDYRHQVDFFAIYNRNSNKSYLVDVMKVPKTGGKLRITENTKKHKGTLMAKDCEFYNIDEIINNFKQDRQKKENIQNLSNQNADFLPDSQENLELDQIIDLLKGKTFFMNIYESNRVLLDLIPKFKSQNPKSNHEYQGKITNTFRNFLITNAKIKSKIIETLKLEGTLNSNGDYIEEIYEYIKNYEVKNNQLPENSLLYHKYILFDTEFLTNCTKSYKRAGGKFSTIEEINQKISDNTWKGGRNTKLNITKAELEKLYKEKSMSQIAREKGVSDKTIAKKIRQMGIEKK